MAQQQVYTTFIEPAYQHHDCRIPQSGGGVYLAITLIPANYMLAQILVIG
jgi:hypothetical protein